MNILYINRRALLTPEKTGIDFCFNTLDEIIQGSKFDADSHPSHST
jgi:hypothetical protein